MSRPESLSDIELNDIEFASVDTGKIAVDGALLKAYATFMEASQKAGAVVESYYGGVKFARRPTYAEQMEQLRSAQSSWDTSKKHYETMRDVGKCEYTHEENQAQRWAEAEGLPWPPESEEITSFDAVIRDIDEAVSA